MLALVAPVIVFGLVIFIHELGHFLAAKLTGVYAPRFSVGFGPALLRMRRGETEYILAAFPLGGYVRMASRHDAETAFIEGGEETDGLKPGDAGYDPEAMIPFGPKPVPEHRWFESKSLAARLFIMIAGVTMNVILAYVVYTGLTGYFGRSIIPTRVVGEVHGPLATSALAQLKAGDTIVAVNGQPVRNWTEMQQRIALAPPGTLALRTQRGEVAVPFGTGSAPKAEDVLVALEPRAPPVIGGVVAGSAALQGGMQAGDTVVSIGGEPIASWQEMVRKVSVSGGQDLAFAVRRAGRTVPLVVRPRNTAELDPITKAPRTVGRIGAARPDDGIREPVGVRGAFVGGAERTWEVSGLIVMSVKRLVSSSASIKELGGPIAIVRASVDAGRSGLLELLILLAGLSLNVAILNLLPIPILDGGQMLINVIESAKGSPLSARTREYVLRIGLAAILLIFLISTYNDLIKLFMDKVRPLFG